jgi:Acetyltransferases, including N-acetylases of ribosomal proteins
MRMMQGIRLDGQSVYLVEVVEAYFPHIIAWRNDPENNRYLNQPFLLTLEKQRTWYAQYCSDPAQGLLIVVDKETDAPFATMGWTDYDPEQRLCITGRLLVGDRRYRGSLLFAEASLLFADYMYGALKVDTCYAHIVRDNIASIRYHEKYGFHRNDGIVRFPNELIVNGMKQGEYARSQADWLSVRARIAQSVAGRGTNEPSRRGAI